MGRKKIVKIASAEDVAIYDKYVKPYHPMIKGTVASLSQKASDYSDNFQEVCMYLLRYIHTLDPSNNVVNWIITIVRRENGKIEAKKDSYVEARKGSDSEFVTEHHGYKKKYRPASAKDFVSSIDNSIFKTIPDKMDFNNGIGERLMTLLQGLMPDTNFGTGTFREVESAIRESGDLDVKILFLMYYDNISVREIGKELNISDGAVKNALSRAKNRIGRVKG
jgi:RNA polymerase sigma factor (sigma-70 family)